MLYTIIFMGRSGCGKGTQVELLKKALIAKGDTRPILHIETGAQFREFVQGQGYSSKLSSDTWKNDLRQPDFLACYMWGGRLIEEFEEDMHLVVDGAPRSRAEAEVFATAMNFYKREKPTIIHLEVSREWSEEKLLNRGRADDKTMQKINARLNWFEEDTEPALGYFRRNADFKFIEIDGENSIEQVSADILSKLDDRN